MESFSNKEKRGRLVTITVQEMIDFLKNSEHEDQRKIGEIMKEQAKKGGVTVQMLMIAARNMELHIPTVAEGKALMEEIKKQNKELGEKE
ncbi:MAG: hypothetical protein HZA35_00040 [Parcubacteria group bacterium]|nr:hypothetical protein [Parcubacteria group bacterium]